MRVSVIVIVIIVEQLTKKAENQPLLKELIQDKLLLAPESRRSKRLLEGLQGYGMIKPT